MSVDTEVEVGQLARTFAELVVAAMEKKGDSITYAAYEHAGVIVVVGRLDHGSAGNRLRRLVDRLGGRVQKAKDAA